MKTTDKRRKHQMRRWKMFKNFHSFLGYSFYTKNDKIINVRMTRKVPVLKNSLKNEFSREYFRRQELSNV